MLEGQFFNFFPTLLVGDNVRVTMIEKLIYFGMTQRNFFNYFVRRFSAGILMNFFDLVSIWNGENSRFFVVHFLAMID